MTLRPAILFMTCSVTYFQVKIKVWSWSKNSGVMQSPTPSLPLFCYLIYECSLNKTVIDNQSIWQYYPILLESFFPFEFDSSVLLFLFLWNFPIFTSLNVAGKRRLLDVLESLIGFFDTSPLNKVFHPPAKMIFQLLRFHFDKFYNCMYFNYFWGRHI